MNLLAMDNTIDTNNKMRAAGNDMQTRGQMIRQQGCKQIVDGDASGGEEACRKGDRLIALGKRVVNQARAMKLDGMTDKEKAIALAHRAGIVAGVLGDAALEESLLMRIRGIDMQEQGQVMRQRGCQLKADADKPVWIRGRPYARDTAKHLQGVRLCADGNKMIVEGKSVHAYGVKLEAQGKQYLRESKKQYKLSWDLSSAARKDT